jgi:hypothetical protein
MKFKSKYDEIRAKALALACNTCEKCGKSASSVIFERDAYERLKNSNLPFVAYRKYIKVLCDKCKQKYKRYDEVGNRIANHGL